MNLFFLDSINADKRYCVVNIMGSCVSELIEGSSARSVMEEDGKEILDLNINTKYSGLELADFVTNHYGVLPLSKICANAIAGNFRLGSYEILPARIINKNVVHSEDYVILNPLGEHNCLNEELSEMDGSTFDPTVRILGKWCLAAERIPNLDLFRVRCYEGYIFSERLVDFIQNQKYKNFNFGSVSIC